MSQVYEKFGEKQQEYDRIEDLPLASQKNAVFEALTAVGVRRVEVTFDGIGDNGWIESISAHRGAADTVDLDQGVRKAIEELCFGLLNSTRPGWQDGEGSCGILRLNVERRQITLEGQERYIDYEDFVEHF